MVRAKLLYVYVMSIKLNVKILGVSCVYDNSTCASEPVVIFSDISMYSTYFFYAENLIVFQSFSLTDTHLTVALSSLMLAWWSRCAAVTHDRHSIVSLWLYLCIQDEMGRLRESYQMSLSAKENHEVETQCLRELYENELRLREKLVSRLEKANEKAAQAAARYMLYASCHSQHSIVSCLIRLLGEV